MRKLIKILDVNIDRVNLAQAVDRIRLLIARTQSSLVVTPNSEMLALAAEDRELARILNSADLATADGIGVVIASKILGEPLPERVAGFDLISLLFKEFAQENLNFYFLGGKPGIVDRAAANLKNKYPDPKELLIEGLKEEGLDPDPSNMEVYYATRGTSEFSKRNAEWLRQHWRKKLGVEITIDMMEWNMMWDKVDQKDYDIVTAGWGPYYNDPNALLQIYDPEDGYFDSSKSGWNNSNSEKYHELLKEASKLTDNKKRAELFLEAEKLLIGKSVIAPTYVGISSTFISKDIGGYYISPHAYTDYTEIYIK